MTRVAFLWHMHQPFYQDLVTGEHILPWVRLHALKDYWGMVALLREFPTVRVTFNLVPSLLVQLEAFARGEARDHHLELGLKPAEDLSDEERAFCIDEFFHAHRPRMIDPYPRYAELLAKRDAARGAMRRTVLAQFSTDDLRDLQVWHKLVWIDIAYHDGDPRTRALLSKGHGFSEDDKRVLREVELELLRRVVTEYREASERGQIEISTSPFYHPILPLLCDSDVYLRTHPQSRMPRERFRHPGDAAEQLSRAAALHRRLFGQMPRGVWPSEGSVSDAMVPLVRAAGYEWMATDEEILARTLGTPLTRDTHGHAEQPELLYQPYQIGAADGHVACGFRDHTLSDLIGFTYSSWPPTVAVDDFVSRLEEAGARYRARGGRGEPTIFIILDGENAWEHYEGQGRPFLRALYGRLAAHPTLRTVTMADACREPSAVLPSIFPGSWIHGDFYIWIGHADDHRAWSQLAEARRALEAPPPGVSPEALSRAREEILIAEGSDWFWWYGDDHSSDHDREFDDLFRRHVRNVYRALEKTIPEELFVTNITTEPPLVHIDPPTGVITPIIDGEVTDYFEWVGAGCVDTRPVVGAMHQVSETGPMITFMEFGFDLDALCVRVEGRVPMRELLALGYEVGLSFLAPVGVRLVISRHGDGLRSALVRNTAGIVWDTLACPNMTVAVGSVLELRVPFSCLFRPPRASVAFVVTLQRAGAEVERHPQHRSIELMVSDEGFASKNWTA